MSWPKSCSRRGRFRMPWRGVGAAAAMVGHGGGVKRRRRQALGTSLAVFLGCATVARRFLDSVSCQDCCYRPLLDFESRSVMRHGRVNIQSTESCFAKTGKVGALLQASRPVSLARDASGESHLTTAGGGQSVRGGLLLELLVEQAAPGRSAVRVP